MPKLKVGDDELPIDELEEAEEGGERSFEPYDGEQPPVGTKLNGYVKKVWWTYTAEKPDGTGGDPMLKVLVIADENDGEEEEFNGCPIWENLTLTAAVKFRWAPMLRCFGLTIRDVKNKTIVSKDDENNGAPVEKIGSWEPGEESDAAWFTMVTDRHKFNGSWQTDVGTWLPFQEEADEEPEPEPEPEPKARRSRRAAPAAEEEEAKPAPTRGARRKPVAKEEPVAPSRGRGRRSGGAKGGEADDEPPF